MQTIADKAGDKQGDKEEIRKVYEIGYVLVSSIPEEKVGTVIAGLKDLLKEKGAEMIAEGAPELRTLAYTMVKKIGPSNHKFSQGYFGWMKFELLGSEIEGIKKAFETREDMLRTLVITTVRTDTYLGKISPAFGVENNAQAAVLGTAPVADAPAIVAKVSTEEIDKSIDEMVK